MNYQLEINSNSHLSIQQHLEASYPNEGCGFFFGREDQNGKRTVLLAEAVPNSKEGEQSRRFEISPLSYVKGEQKALELGLALLGIYHSHPNHPAIPSELDLKQALPYFSYIILSVQGGKASEMTSWRLNEETLQFDNEELLLVN